MVIFHSYVNVYRRVSLVSRQRIVAALAPNVAFFTEDCSQRSAPFGDADRSATAVLRPKNSIVFVHRMLPPIALDLKFSNLHLAQELPSTHWEAYSHLRCNYAIICNEKNNRQTKNRKNWSKKERVQQRKEGMKKRKKEERLGNRSKKEGKQRKQGKERHLLYQAFSAGPL